MEGEEDSNRSASGGGPGGATDRPGRRHPELDDDTLLRCCAGDAAAQAALARMYEPRIREFLARYLSPRPTEVELEELAAKVLEKALRAIGRFKPSPRARLSTWLLTIALRVGLDWLKERAVDSKGIADYRKAQEAFSSPISAPDEVLDRKRLGEKIERAARRLSAEQRGAFLLFYYEGVPYKEIAETFGVSVGTVKTWLHDGREKMQRYMKGEWDEYKGRSQD